MAVTLHDLRNPKTRDLQAEVWEARDDRDEYTRLCREIIQAGGKQNPPNVDHVVEVQMLREVVNRALESVPVAGRTRGGLGVMREVMVGKVRLEGNSVPALNVTSSRVNQAKRGAVRSFCNDLAKQRENGAGGVVRTWDECVGDSRSKSKGYMQEVGAYGRIGKEMVRVHDKVLAPAFESLQATNHAAAQALIEEAAQLIDKLGI